MNAIIEDMMRAGIPVTTEFNKGKDRFVYTIDGFYKSGTVTLYEEDGKLIAHARYDEHTEITCVRDIVALNYDWWDFSKDRFNGWAQPDYRWAPLLVSEGFLEAESKTVTQYTKPK